MVTEAHVREKWELGAIEVFLVERGGASTNMIIELKAGERAVAYTFLETEDVGGGLLIPRHFAEPLRNALDAFIGKPQDDWRSRYEEARDALAVERRRVDELLAGYAARNP